MGAFRNGVYVEHLDIPEAKAAARRYASALDAESGPAPLVLDPEPPTMDGIRDRMATGAGDRRQLQADIAFLLDRVSVLVTNAEIGPDPRMKGMADCYFVPLDDIEAMR